MTEVRIDIISDVVCPWCAIGYKRLERALIEHVGELTAAIVWHPFELNPNMPEAGQNLQAHVAEKYGASADQSSAARAQLTELAASLDLTFRYGADTRIFNTFKAHQLLHWALRLGRQGPLTFALFDAYFARAENVANTAVLLDAVEQAGLDRAEATAVLEEGRYAADVRAEERFWTERGITGVPTFILGGRYLVQGAQEPTVFAEVLARLESEQQQNN